MSREIKFRAWRLNGEMYKPFDLTNLVSDEYAGESWLDCGDGLHIDHKTGWDSLKIMQYTGLKDKNGKEIYEGDVVHISGIGNYEITDICQDFDMLVNAKVEGDLNEIVGNIYENPELITGGKNG